jgi:mRNA interferase RelE/StbE
MKLVFKKSFLKDIKKLRLKFLKESVAECILQVESAEKLSEIKNLKKLTGYDVYYRIRVGDYRIGLKVEDEIIYFVVLDHRKEVYRNFP